MHAFVAGFTGNSFDNGILFDAVVDLPILTLHT
jgi:hypothetical protein